MLKILLTLLVAVFATNCSNNQENDEESRSIDDIHQEQGFPVRVESVELKSLETWRDYGTTLEGYNETNVIPMLNDRLTSINVKVGDFVRKGQVIAVFDTNHPQAQYNQAKIQYETMDNSYRRMKSLVESGGISRQQFEEIEAQYKVAKRNYNTIKDMIYVKAPISGVVTNMFVDENKFIDPSQDAICQISSLNKLKAKIFVEERNISQFEKGQPVRVTWEAYPGKEFSGFIETISISAVSQVRGFSVEIKIDNPDRILRPGIFADIYIKTADIEEAVIISRHSIVIENNKSFVYLAEGSRAVKTEVKTGIESGTEVVIEEGLMANDNLITEGITFLEDNAKINIVN